MFVSSDVLKESKISEFHDIAVRFSSGLLIISLREWYLYFDSMNWILLMH